jgi:hypothetical protein
VIFLYYVASRQAQELTHPLSSGYRGFVLGLKRPGREAEHLPPPSAEAKSGGALPPLIIPLHGGMLN